jgi:hypothetical protein
MKNPNAVPTEREEALVETLQRSVFPGGRRLNE